MVTLISQATFESNPHTEINKQVSLSGREQHRPSNRYSKALISFHYEELLPLGRRILS